MSIKLFENEELFKELVGKHNLNLFLGAGFSVLAKNKEDTSLPLGNSICSILKEKFDITSTRNLTLGQVCRKIKTSRDNALTSFLKETYTVKSFDDIYLNLLKLPINNIFTLNIDNLIEKIYESDESTKSVSDVEIYGDTHRENIVNLYKLHGSVTYPFDKPMSFSVEELQSLFMTNPSRFEGVSYKLSQSPCIFWGTSLMDGNTLQLLCKSRIGNTYDLPKWIVLYPHDPNYEELLEEYQEQNFSVISADTKELLEYLSGLPFSNKQLSDSNDYIFRQYRNSFPSSFVCNELKKSSMSRPIKDFFYGSEPQISDISSNSVIRTSHFNEVVNRVMSDKITLLTGIPGCGKSTLLLQLAFSDELSGRKFWFRNMIPSEAERLVSLLKEDSNATVFLDNLYDNLDAFKILKNSKLKLVIAERSINYEYVKTSLNINYRQVVDISDLSNKDIQEICKRMNKVHSNVSTFYKDRNVSLLEIVFYIFHSTTVAERISQYIISIENLNDKNIKIDLLELYTLINYVSYCGVPISMDMLMFYFSAYDVNFEEIYYALNKLSSVVVEFSDSNMGDLHEQDYMIMRSKVFADVSIKKIPDDLLKKVLLNFFANVSHSTIYRYDIFRKKSYDADITSRAFNYQEGQNFYDRLIEINKNPYIKHQYSLFLKRKNKIDHAWSIIDQAYTETYGKVMSIANTHAVMLFDRNIDVAVDVDNELKLKELLKQSFDLLYDCTQKDTRVTYHVLIYARNTIQYYDKFGSDNYYIIYSKNALMKIEEILNSDEYIYKKMRDELLDLQKQLSSTKAPI